jgi:hypothetical protein
MLCGKIDVWCRQVNGQTNSLDDFLPNNKNMNALIAQCKLKKQYMMG